jgi:hypothetical protein
MSNFNEICQSIRFTNLALIISDPKAFGMLTLLCLENASSKETFGEDYRLVFDCRDPSLNERAHLFQFTDRQISVLKGDLIIVKFNVRIDE